MRIRLKLTLDIKRGRPRRVRKVRLMPMLPAFDLPEGPDLAAELMDPLDEYDDSADETGIVETWNPYTGYA